MEATTIIEQAIADAITDELGTGPGLAVQELQAIRGLLERPAATAQPATLLSMARDFLRQRFDMSTAHAPSGGVTIQGKHFVGGEFIPAKDMKNATAEEKQAVGIETGMVPDKDPANVTDDAYKRGTEIYEHGGSYTTVLKEAL